MPVLTPIQQLGNNIILFIPTILAGLVTFILFWLVSIAVGRIITRLANTAKIDVIVRKLLADSARLFILIIGLITALGTIGINVSALVAGLGLTSLALGLALQPVLANMVSGVLILVYHPFRLNDTVKLSNNNNEGVVVNIDLRYTTLEAEGKTILIPNQQVFSNVVIVNRPPDRIQADQ